MSPPESPSLIHRSDSRPWTQADIERLRRSPSNMPRERWCVICGAQVEPDPDVVFGRLPERCRTEHGNQTRYPERQAKGC